MKNEKVITIFISSTFNDMQAERDYIRKFVLPRLEHELTSTNIILQITDLRWGVDTRSVEENEREATVLHVCLNAIKNTRPFFVGLLGDRYGWIPDNSRWASILNTLKPEEKSLLGETNGKSVTEMEIVFGAIGNSQVLPHSLFFFRSQDSYKNIPNDKLAFLQDEYSSSPQQKINATKLKALKQKIKDTCIANNYENNLFEYTTKWDIEKEAFSQLEEFGDKLYNALLREIKEEIDIADYQTTLSPLWQEENALESFIIDRTRYFKGRQKLIEKLENFLLHKVSASDILDETTGYILTGFSGCGKSAVFSMLCRHLETLKEEKKLVILSHSAGITPSSISIEEMLERWCNKIQSVLGIRHEKGNPQYFTQLIVRLQMKGYQPVILIDSLDSFQPSHLFNRFNFLPDNIPCFCTSLPEVIPPPLVQKMKFKVINMDYLTEQEAQMVVKEVMERNNKQLPELLVKQLLALKDEKGIPSYSSPLWLQMCLSILLELGEDDFKEIHREQLEQEDEKIEAFLLRTIKVFPTDANGLFQQLLQLTYHYFNKDLSQEILSLIALSRFGINEKDMECLLDARWNALDFANLQCWMRRFINNNFNKNWNFTHNKLRESMLQSDPEYIRSIQQKLFDYLLEKAEEDKDSLKELIYQCIVNKEYEQFYYLIYQRYKYNCIEDIINNWLLVERAGDTFAFIEHFITYYTKEEDNEWLVYIIKTLIYDGRRNPESRQYIQARQLIDIGLSLYPKEKIIGGNNNILRNYFALCETNSEYYNSINQPLECKRVLEEASGIFFFNRIKYQATFLNANFECTYFYCWNNYIQNLYMQRNKEDYNKKFNQFFQELLWFYDHQEINEYTSIPIRFNSFNQNIRPFVRYELMTNQQKIEYSQKFQEKIMLWKDYVTPESSNIDDFAENILETLEHYVAFFESEQYSPTALTNFIIDNSYRMGDFNFFKILKTSSTDKDETEFTEEYNEEDEDWYIDEDLIIDDIEISDANETDTDKESPNGEETSDVSKEIWETEKYLEECIASLDWDDTELFIDPEILHNFYKHFIYLASLYSDEKKDQKGLDTLNLLASLLIKKSLYIADNYVVNKDKMKDLIDLSNQYQKLGYHQECRNLLEIICKKIYPSFLHHIDHEQVKIPFIRLMHWYEDHQLIKESFDLQEKLFELTYRHFKEYVYHSPNQANNDLHYASQFYKYLLDDYECAKEIEKAKVLKMKWAELIQISKIKPVKDKKLTRYQYIRPMHEHMRAVAFKTSKNSIWDNPTCNFINKDNKILNQESYNDVGNFHEGLAWICSGDTNAYYGFKGIQFGFIDQTGKTVIPMIYDDATSFYNGKALVYQNKKLFYIDKEGKWIEDF